MAFTFARWQTMLAAQVSKIRETETGHPTLLMDDEADEDVLFAWYRDGVKPTEAARRFFAGEARPERQVEIATCQSCGSYQDILTVKRCPCGGELL